MITPEQGQAMGDIMSLFNEGVAGAVPVAPKTADTGSMSKIMEAFSSMSEDLVSHTDAYPELKKALVTEVTSTGTRVGSWKIDLRDVDGAGKFYDVVHALTNEPIASDLRLYEAALTLVNALNEGQGITSMKVKTILNIEGDYARALTDAVGFAARVKMTEGAQRDIAEARYSEAKRKAIQAKKALNAVNDLF
jgi:hypothetical protein